MFFSILGVTLILFGLSLTPLFQRFRRENYIAVGAGGVMQIPFLIWLVYIFCPAKKERGMRSRIHADRLERHSKGFFDTLVNEANSGMYVYV